MTISAIDVAVEGSAVQGVDRKSRRCSRELQPSEQFQADGLVGTSLNTISVVEARRRTEELLIMQKEMHDKWLEIQQQVRSAYSTNKNDALEPCTKAAAKSQGGPPNACKPKRTSSLKNGFHKEKTPSASGQHIRARSPNLASSTSSIPIGHPLQPLQKSSKHTMRSRSTPHLRPGPEPLREVTNHQIKTASPLPSCRPSASQTAASSLQSGGWRECTRCRAVKPRDQFPVDGSGCVSWRCLVCDKMQGIKGSGSMPTPFQQPDPNNGVQHGPCAITSSDEGLASLNDSWNSAAHVKEPELIPDGAYPAPSTKEGAKLSKPPSPLSAEQEEMHAPQLSSPVPRRSSTGSRRAHSASHGDYLLRYSHNSAERASATQETVVQQPPPSTQVTSNKDLQNSMQPKLTPEGFERVGSSRQRMRRHSQGETAAILERLSRPVFRPPPPPRPEDLEPLPPRTFSKSTDLEALFERLAQPLQRTLTASSDLLHEDPAPAPTSASGCHTKPPNWVKRLSRPPRRCKSAPAACRSQSHPKRRKRRSSRHKATPPPPLSQAAEAQESKAVAMIPNNITQGHSVVHALDAIPRMDHFPVPVVNSAPMPSDPAMSQGHSPSPRSSKSHRVSKYAAERERILAKQNLLYQSVHPNPQGSRPSSSHGSPSHRLSKTLPAPLHRDDPHIHPARPSKSPNPRRALFEPTDDSGQMPCTPVNDTASCQIQFIQCEHIAIEDDDDVAGEFSQGPPRPFSSYSLPVVQVPYVPVTPFEPFSVKLQSINL